MSHSYFAFSHEFDERLFPSLAQTPSPTLDPDDLVSLTFDLDLSGSGSELVILAAPCPRDIRGDDTSDENFVYAGRDGSSPGGMHSVATVTDLCYSSSQTEVDLITLVEEQLPRYTLRADTITKFSGYDHADFIQTPIVPSDIVLDLTPELIEETLKYFIICAERVTQMTRAYNDIEAVTHLLEEKERDLELAARIGQSLLQRNKELERRNSEQGELLAENNDKISQMRHDLAQKEALLQLYMHDEEMSPETPEEERIQVSLGVANICGLQKKVKTLEDENLALRSQSVVLKTETVLQEEKELDIFKDCIKQLEEYKSQVFILQEEIIAKSDLSLQQQEEITALTAKTIAQDDNIKKAWEENTELSRRLQAAQEAQKELSTEISELEGKNVELEILIDETQEEMKSLRKKQKPAFIRHHANYNSPFLPEGSLALELEDSIRKDVPCPPGYTPRERRQHNKRVMQTAKVVKKTQHSPGVSSANESCESIQGSSVRSSLYLSESETSEAGYGADVDSVYGGSTSTLGRPGLPGSNDLETALRRLTLKRSQESMDHVGRRRRSTYRSDGWESPGSCRTPDSTMSNGSFSNLSDFSRISGISNSFRIPEKLQIVKPLEGSFTLHQWKRLATPHLAGVLEHRPGIQTKGECPTDTAEEEIYSLSDFEEDDDYSLHLGKCMEQTSGVYTYTTAKILHPTDEYGPTSGSTVYDQATPSTDVQLTYTSTPRVSSSVTYARMNDFGTSTFSMSSGLAMGLQERGIQDGRPPAFSSCSSQRYGNIVTETISSSTQSQTETLYTTASAESSTAYTKSSESGTTVLLDREEAYLHLADKMKDIGLNSILTIAKRSGIAPVTLDPVDSGLNVIMSIKRNKGAVNRDTAEKAQTIQYTKYARPKVGRRKGTLPSSTSSQMVLTNSTKVVMATRPIISTSAGKMCGISEEDPLLKTLPPSTFHKRPNTLDIGGDPNAKSSEKDYNFGLDISSVISGAQGEPSLCSGVTVGQNTMSTGLLSHLSNIYSKTKDILGGGGGGGGGGAAAAGLLPSTSQT